jgi:hypothetical protein
MVAYQSASGQKSLQRQYSTYDPLLIKDLSVSHAPPLKLEDTDSSKSVNIRCNNGGALGTGVTGSIAAGAKLKVHWYSAIFHPDTQPCADQ